MPSFSACCRSDPTVRFIALAILSTGVFALECLRNSTCIAFVHATVFRFAFVATFLVTVFLAMHLSKIVRRSITHRSADATFCYEERTKTLYLNGTKRCRDF